MKTIDKEGEVLLAVLLVITRELLTAVAKVRLELPWHEGLLRIPHFIKQLTEGEDKTAFEAHRVPYIGLFHVKLFRDEVLMDNFEIGDHLKRTVHVACVSHVLKAYSRTSGY